MAFCNKDAECKHPCCKQEDHIDNCDCYGALCNMSSNYNTTEEKLEPQFRMLFEQAGLEISLRCLFHWVLDKINPAAELGSYETRLRSNLEKTYDDYINRYNNIDLDQLEPQS